MHLDSKELMLTALTSVSKPVTIRICLARAPAHAG